jgi:hypothetical protein
LLKIGPRIGAGQERTPEKYLSYLDTGHWPIDIRRGNRLADCHPFDGVFYIADLPWLVIMQDV